MSDPKLRGTSVGKNECIFERSWEYQGMISVAGVHTVCIYIIYTGMHHVYIHVVRVNMYIYIYYIYRIYIYTLIYIIYINYMHIKNVTADNEVLVLRYNTYIYI